MTSSPRRHHDRDRGQGGRPPVSFVAWGAVSGRSREIAAALGGEAHCLFPPEASWRPHAAVRYVLCTLDTVVYLVRRRPRSIIVTNPPLVAGYVVWACGRLLGCPVVLDSHPGGFGAQGDEVSARLQHLHRWLVRHVDGCAVASAPWVEVVQGWGGRAVELHEAPAEPPGALGTPAGEAQAPAGQPRSGDDRETQPPAGGQRDGTRPGEVLQVLCVGRLAPDEPSGEVIDAAALVPDCRFLVTGDPDRAPDLVARAPGNVTFTGFLGPDDYMRALHTADVVMTLTTEPSSVMRAAYEAVYACQPLIVTDWPVGQELFPHALHVANEAGAIAGGVRRAREGLGQLIGVAGDARALQLDRWDAQLGALRRLLRLADHGDSGVGRFEDGLGGTIPPTLPEA